MAEYSVFDKIEALIDERDAFEHIRSREPYSPSRWLSASMHGRPKKSIYSLIDLREILLGCNRRYLEYLSAIDDHSADGARSIGSLTSAARTNRPIKGVNFFNRTEQQLLRALKSSAGEPQQPHRQGAGFIDRRRPLDGSLNCYWNLLTQNRNTAYS